ncbi:MAG: hypothetical protein DWQ04_30910 [Chloroflexi bacterium]|nr:MAG: hypothetical protein DWQ04_30910 [Chloroflexota bacterium]
MMPKRYLFIGLCVLLSVWIIVFHQTGFASLKTAVPNQSGPCTVTKQTDTINNVNVDIYHPTNCGASRTAPFPGIAFAHGFSMFGLSDGRAANKGNGEHLASWGYVVAIPKLPDGAEDRLTILRNMLGFLENDSQVDSNRLATVGYSLGGATALAAAARDNRVQAVVALDPVFHEGGPSGEGPIVWDAAAEAPQINVPAGILGAPPSSCNAESDYKDLYPLVGATHKAYYHIEEASHCVFTDPGNNFCGGFCSGVTDSAKTDLSQKYMTAWLNYYLYYETDYYDYLFGNAVLADMNASLIASEADTAPEGVAAEGEEEAIQLTWTRYEHPIAAGYTIQRRLVPGEDEIPPLVELGSIDMYQDTAVTPNLTYGYQIASRDAAGNLHGWSEEVTAVPDPPSSTPTATESGPCTVTKQTNTVNSVNVDIYYPSNCGAGRSSPYPGIAFAHGFSFFGISDGVAANAGNGAHLASWGYVVAIPTLPDSAEDRLTILRNVLGFLENDSQVDPNRLATVGYSLGGATALAAAARDNRVQAVVALDPVFHEGGPSGEGPIVWNAAAEAPQISVPTGILGAPADNCNADADYVDIYPLVGATHKAYYHIEGASHCAFPDPGNFFCSIACGGTTGAEKTDLSQKYMTAWLNYYLYYETSYYEDIYGSSMTADVSANLITSAADTAPDGVAAKGLLEANQLSWSKYTHPMIAGYSVQRRLVPGTYPEAPFTTLGAVNAYQDTAVTPNLTYGYKVTSRDPAGNLHQWSGEVTAVPAEAKVFLYLPIVMK